MSLIAEVANFTNRLVKSWLQDNNIEIYSIYNEAKFVFAEKFVSTLKNKIYKYITSVSKNMYIDELVDIVNKNNNKYSIIKMKPPSVKSSTYIDFNTEKHDKDRKFEVGEHIKISKYKNNFVKGYTSNWSEEVFKIKRVKSTVPWTYVIEDLNGEEIFGMYYEKGLKKTDQTEVLN